MVDESKLGTLYVEIKADTAALKAELTNLRGAVTAELGATTRLIDMLFTQMSQRAAKGTAAATQVAQKSITEQMDMVKQQVDIFNTKVAGLGSRSAVVFAENYGKGLQSKAETMFSSGPAIQAAIQKMNTQLQQQAFETFKKGYVIPAPQISAFSEANLSQYTGQLKEQQQAFDAMKASMDKPISQYSAFSDINMKKTMNRFKDIGKEMEKVEKAQNEMKKGADEYNRTLERLTRTAAAFIAMWVIKEIISGFNQLISVGIEFNAKLEQARLGIASIVMAQGEFIDQFGQLAIGFNKFTQAQKLSDDIINKLKIDNLQTIATLDQLIKAFQQGLAPAMVAGFNIDQAREFTVAMVQAAGAIGMNLDMLGEELRSIVTGTISPHTSFIATALGIRPEDIRRLQGDSEALFAFIMKRLESFRIAGVESQKTFYGLWSNLKDAFSVVSGEASKPLFEYLKREISNLIKGMVTIDNVTKEMIINPTFIRDLEVIYTLIRDILDVIKGLGTGLYIALGPLGTMLEIFQTLDRLLERISKSKPLDVLSSFAGKVIGKMAYLDQLRLILEGLKEFEEYLGPSESQLREMERASRIAYELTPSLKPMPKEMMQELKAGIDAELREKQRGYDKEMSAWEAASQIRISLLDKEVAKKLLLDKEYERQKTEILDNALISENFTLERSIQSTINAFEEKRDALLKHSKYAPSTEGYFGDRKAVIDAEKKMLDDVDKLREQIDKNDRERLENKAKLEIKLIELEDARIREEISLKQMSADAESTYAASIGAIETVNDLLHIQADLKNKLIELDWMWYAKFYPELQEYIDRLIEINKLSAGHQEILNNLERSMAFANANEQLAQLTYSYEGIKAAEQALLDVEIKRYRLTLSGSEESRKLLAIYEQIYQLKSEELYKPTELSSLAGAASFLFDITGSEEYLSKYVDFNNKILAEERKKNSALIGSEEELQMLMLEKAMRFYNDYLGLQESFLNKQINAYKKLYQHTLYQQYLDKITETQNKMLDIYDEKNKQLGLNERDVHRLRMIQMADNQKEMLDLIQQGANREIDIQANKARSINEQYERGFNIPIPGTNISSVTGSPIGYAGSIVRGPGVPGGSKWFPSPGEAASYLRELEREAERVKSEKKAKEEQEAQNQLAISARKASEAMADLTREVERLRSAYKSSYDRFQSFVTERERRPWGATEWSNEFDRLVKAFQDLNPQQADYFDQSLSLLDDMTDTLRQLDSLEQKALQEQKNLVSTLRNTFASLNKAIADLEFGPEAPVQSVELFSKRYLELYNAALTASGEDVAKAVDEFLSFIPSYLEFMKNFGGGYAQVISATLKDLKELKGKTGLEIISTGFAISANEIFKIKPDSQIEVMMNEVFKEKDWLPTSINLFEDVLDFDFLDADGKFIFKPESISLLGNILKFTFLDADGKFIYNATSISLFEDVLDFLFLDKDGKFIFAPESVDLFKDILKFAFLDADGKFIFKPESISLFENVLDFVFLDKEGKFIFSPESVSLFKDVLNFAFVDADGKLNWVPEKVNLLKYTGSKGILDFSFLFPDGKLAWSPERVTLFGHILNFAFLNNVGKLTWIPEAISLFGNILNFVFLDENGNFNWVPEPVNVEDLVAFDWSDLFADITTGNLDGAISKITTLVGILGATDAKGLVGAAITAAGGANKLIDSLTGTLGPNLTTSATSATKGTGDLTHSLTQTYYPFEETASNLTSLSNSIKDNLVTLWGFFDTLAKNLGITLNAGTATALINAGAFTKTVLQQGHWEQLPIYMAIRTNQWGNEVLSQAYQDPVTRQPVFGNFGNSQYATVYVPAGYARGGLTGGLSLAGEKGSEWIVPTYEPERNAFLQSAPKSFWDNLNSDKSLSSMMVTKSEDINPLYKVPTTKINIDSEAIGNSIAKKLAPILMNQEGKEIHIHVEVDRKEIANAVIKEGKGNIELIESVRRMVG